MPQKIEKAHFTKRVVILKKFNLEICCIKKLKTMKKYEKKIIFSPPKARNHTDYSLENVYHKKLHIFNELDTPAQHIKRKSRWMRCEIENQCTVREWQKRKKNDLRKRGVMATNTLWKRVI